MYLKRLRRRFVSCNAITKEALTSLINVVLGINDDDKPRFRTNTVNLSLRPDTCNVEENKLL